MKKIVILIITVIIMITFTCDSFRFLTIDERKELSKSSSSSNVSSSTLSSAASSTASSSSTAGASSSSNISSVSSSMISSSTVSSSTGVSTSSVSSSTTSSSLSSVVSSTVSSISSAVSSTVSSTVTSSVSSSVQASSSSTAASSSTSISSSTASSAGSSSAISSSTASSASSTIPRNGLVGEWLFDGNANDTSGNGNNGTVNGATLTADRFGTVGKAYSFDGVNDYISQLPAISSGDFSYSVWINFKNPLQSAVQAIIVQRDTSTGYPIITTQYDPNGINFLMRSNNLDGSISIIHNPACIANTWYYCSFLKSGNNLKIYINGLNVKSDVYSGSSWNLANITNIGRDPYDGIRWFNGLIDDVRIYNRALTDSEITALYQEGGWTGSSSSSTASSVSSSTASSSSSAVSSSTASSSLASSSVSSSSFSSDVWNPMNIRQTNSTIDSFTLSWNSYSGADNYKIYDYNGLVTQTTNTAISFTSQTRNSLFKSYNNDGYFKIVPCTGSTALVTSGVIIQPTMVQVSEIINSNYTDNFNDNIINSTYLFYQRNYNSIINVVENNGYLDLQLNSTDHGPSWQIPINIGTCQQITIKFKFYAHRANEYSGINFGFYFDSYYRLYNASSGHAGDRNSFFISMMHDVYEGWYGLKYHMPNPWFTRENISNSELYDVWVPVEFKINKASNSLTLKFNTETYTIPIHYTNSSDIFTIANKNLLIFYTGPGGWYTGHYLRLDDFEIVFE